ncbi:hypothetical protein GQ43DRAFT_267799 [Delitschia confertaspora ATCC 74209]|uniref:Uncharacterized protein n=1 Tax=Delitschia confertaspora ATCC 74209 TaxID=1513339 RepID=A0A9P4JU75_9PLEO|nr:hypothetical protein GQ43DRAFT_267799 [Delitschia confertaspora ATCC 74209]
MSSAGAGSGRQRNTGRAAHSKLRTAFAPGRPFLRLSYGKHRISQQSDKERGGGRKDQQLFLQVFVWCAWSAMVAFRCLPACPLPPIRSYQVVFSSVRLLSGFLCQ